MTLPPAQGGQQFAPCNKPCNKLREGLVGNWDRSDGNRGQRPQSVAPVTEMLRLNGYSTAAFGKYHETAPWEVSVSGPFDGWPTRSGFDKFYGFIGGETNQFAPVLHDGTAPVEQSDDPDYHFTTDMTDQAITWARSQQSLTPDKPFFIYFATGATHAPHHVPADWVDRYKGKFDDGWDAYREQTLARQIELGVVPPGTQLASKPADIADWDTLSADEKRLYARQMEVFAAFAEHTDHEVGRLVDAIEAMDEMDNTLFIYIFGDNGSSAEGGLTGTFNETIVLNALSDSVEDQLQHLDEWGGPLSYPHFQAGWAVATNTPFQWTKQVASHYGGTRNPLVVHWPDGIRVQGRNTFAVAPRDRHCANADGGRRPAVSECGQRCNSEALRRREPDLFIRRFGCCRSAHHAVFRNVRQPCDLP